MDTLSAVCCIAGLLAASLGLYAGIRSFGAEGLEKIGIIFIPRSIIAILVILADLLALVLKRWVIWSWVSTVIKWLCIVLFIKPLFQDLLYQLQYGVSNFFFDIMVIASLLILIIPSVWNIIRLNMGR